jgi:hypothetical protein
MPGDGSPRGVNIIGETEFDCGTYKGNEVEHAWRSAVNDRVQKEVRTGKRIKQMPLDYVYNDVWIIEDDGTLTFSGTNSFDTPNSTFDVDNMGGGVYEIAAASYSFDATLGSQIFPGDDGAILVNMLFSFPYGGSNWSQMYVGANGGVASSGDSRQGGHLDAQSLEIAPDGRFEVILSSEPRPGNWLRMTPDTTALIVRQTFLDRTREVPASLRIERIGGDGTPTPLTPEGLDAGLQTAAGLVVSCAALFASWAEGFQKHTNELPKFDDAISMGAGGDPNICYYHSYWRLAPDEALVIEVTPPRCEAWNFQLDNHWMESLDYRYHRIHVNKHTARYRDDGSVRIVVAHRDPGVENWIETTGHTQGTMCFRWIRADDHPQPRTRVVKVAELAG